MAIIIPFASTHAKQQQGTERLSLLEHARLAARRLIGRFRTSGKVPHPIRGEGSRVPAPIVFRSAKFRTGRNAGTLQNFTSGDAA